jgi:CheY-like chemotaxis protein
MSPTAFHVSRPTGAGTDGLDRVTLPRLLLVEDDVPVRDSLREALQEEGFRVVTAANGRDALAVLRRGPRPDAILLDLMLPVMDGWDFRQEQLRDPALSDIPVLIVTATGFSAETVRAQFGDVGLFPKPIPFLDLLAAIDRICFPSSAP